MPVQAIAQITSTVIAGGVAIKGMEILGKSLPKRKKRKKKSRRRK